MAKQHRQARQACGSTVVSTGEDWRGQTINHQNSAPQGSPCRSSVAAAAGRRLAAAGIGEGRHTAAGGIEGSHQEDTAGADLEGTLQAKQRSSKMLYVPLHAHKPYLLVSPWQWAVTAYQKPCMIVCQPQRLHINFHCAGWRSTIFSQPLSAPQHCGRKPKRVKAVAGKSGWQYLHRLAI